MPYVAGIATYIEICEEVAGEGYRGSKLDPANAPARANELQQTYPASVRQEQLEET